MKFSVIIPIYQDWDRLKRCVSALMQQTFDHDQYEVVIVNNDREGKVPDNFLLPDRAKLIHQPDPGSYAARNKGVRIASGEILAFTDSDCIPDKNWLANAKELFEQSKCDLIGGKIEIFNEDVKNKYGYLYDRVTAFPQYKNVPEGKGVTANLFVKRPVFEAAGGFNSIIKSGGDWEFTQRCTGLGYQMIYSENILVLHPARDLLAIFKKQFRLTCGGAIKVKKSYGHSYLRIWGSHILHGLKFKREYLQKTNGRERAVIFFIDLTKYLYRSIIYGGLLFHIIDPEKIR